MAKKRRAVCANRWTENFWYKLDLIYGMGYTLGKAREEEP